MADSIHVDAAAAAGDSWVEVDFANHAYVYVSFEIYVAAAQMVDWRTQSRGGPSNLLLLAGTGTTGNSGAEVEAVNLRDHVGGQPTYDSWQTDTFSDLVGGVAGGSWHVLQLVFDSGAANGSSLDADGTSVTGTNAHANASHLLLGIANGFGPGHRGELWLGQIKVGTTHGASDLLLFTPATAPDLSAFSATHGTVTLATAPTPPASVPAAPTPVGTGGVRIAVAFDDDTLAESPVWTYLTATDNLVAGYSKDVGRQYEFDKTDTGTASISISDVHGVLDPTNTTGPYYGKIEPLLQVQIELYDPVAATWHKRFRGFIEDYNYTVDPSVHFENGDAVGVMRLQIECVDLFEILTAIEMQPGEFGDPPPAASDGQVFFDNATAKGRILQVLGNSNIPTGFYVIFDLNVSMQETVYSPSENVLQVVQDAADAEFPTVSNVYCDRTGRLAVHGRLAKFDPAGTAMGADWDFTHWQAGDQDIVLSSPSDTAHIRTLAFNRGLSKVFNSCFCTPNGIADADVSGQYTKDATSIGKYGYRSWSAENLLIDTADLTGNTRLVETHQYAIFIKQRYKTPRNRVTEISFRSMDPTATGAGANWALLTGCDISDLIDISEANPGNGGLAGDTWFIEGVHEEVQPLNGTYADVTLSLDLSPGDIFIGHGAGTGYDLDG